MFSALCDVNIPKFLPQDLELFHGIISDLFPGKHRPQTDYGPLLDSIYYVIEEMNLQRDEVFVSKILQLYEVTLIFISF